MLQTANQLGSALKSLTIVRDPAIWMGPVNLPGHAFTRILLFPASLNRLNVIPCTPKTPQLIQVPGTASKAWPSREGSETL